jgi:sulfotransferase
MRKIHFISGLPRSGSTLLQNILLQNDKLYASPTSSLLDFLLQVRDNWSKLEGHSTYPDGQDKWKVIRSILQNYHNTDRNVVFDKNRGWSTHIEFVEKVMNRPARIIACVRNLEDICTSFEKLFRKNRADGEIHGEFSNTQMKNLDGRIGVWTSDDGVLGRPYVSLLDTINRGLGDRILFFPYESWTADPDYWFEQLYNFIEEPFYQHDFESISQTIRENDAGYGWGPDLHEIKTGKLIAAKSDAMNVVGQEWYKKLHDTEFWKANGLVKLPQKTDPVQTTYSYNQRRNDYVI